MKYTFTDMPRSGIKDLWNAFMVKNASFDVEGDMPICISSDIVPEFLISYDDAKTMYKKEMRHNNPDFFCPGFVHFYIDDQKFDGKRNSIWTNPFQFLEIIRHFGGIITPDFSTYTDFPDAVKRYNTYRMRAIGCWMNNLNIPVINNVRWGTYETWEYCFSGIPKGSTIAIGTVASGIRQLNNRPIFTEGFPVMLSRIQPKRIISYGSVNYPFIQELPLKGIEIISFPSKTSQAFSGRRIV